MRRVTWLENHRVRARVLPTLDLASRDDVTDVVGRLRIVGIGRRLRLSLLGLLVCLLCLLPRLRSLRVGRIQEAVDSATNATSNGASTTADNRARNTTAKKSTGDGTTDASLGSGTLETFPGTLDAISEARLLASLCSSRSTL